MTTFTDPGPGVINALHLRKVLGPHHWKPPTPFGRGWLLRSADDDGNVLATAAQIDGRVIIHASMTRNDRVPDYDDLVLLHRGIWQDGRHPNGHAYLCFVPPAEHVNYHPRALHLYGWRDGGRMVPDMSTTLVRDGKEMRMI